jgi:cytochrome P450
MKNIKPPDWNPNSASTQRDQIKSYDSMRRLCPVAYDNQRGWSLFKHQDILNVLNDHHSFSNVVSKHHNIPNGMDQPEHTIYRAITSKYLSNTDVDTFKPKCSSIIYQLISLIPESKPIEIMEHLAIPFSTKAQCAYLGWKDDLHIPLILWASKNKQASIKGNKHQLRSLAQEFESFILDIININKQHLTLEPNSITHRLCIEGFNGKILKQKELISVLRNWTAGEIGTISSAIGIIINFLATHPEIQSKIRLNPDLIPSATEEILRLHGPLVTNKRKATKNKVIGCKEIEEGEFISINWVSANRDENAFHDSKSFDINRDQSNNLLYGAGIHICPGATLARLEINLITTALLSHFSNFKPSLELPTINAIYPSSGFSSLGVVFTV